VRVAPFVSVLVLAVLALAGCSRFAPEPLARAGFVDRAATQESDDLRVHVSALSAEESRRYLGLELASQGVQPIWMKIENRTDAPAWFLPIATDPSYFAPFEVAYMFHRVLSGERNQQLDAHLLSTAMPLEVPPRGEAQGFVYTHLGEGARYVPVEVLSDGRVRAFHFIAEVPGGRWDFEKVDFAAIYPRSEVRDLDLPALLAAIERLPCCARNEEGTRDADPLNLVVVGEIPAALFPFVERGWNLTEPFDAGSAWRTVKAFLLGSRYLTSPVSPLYAYGRPQDAALQKARNDIDRRNHLRLWRAPFDFQGTPVWIGQVSRDIGVRLTTSSWYLTTHKIDPDVDEDRDYLLQDLALSGYVSRVGLVPGVGAAPRGAPRHNLTGDPYFTDGRRLVVFLDPSPGPVDRIHFLTP
jgi:hypothetical protein